MSKNPNDVLEYNKSILETYMVGKVKGAPKTGGRVKRTPNRVTADAQRAITQAQRVIAKELTKAQIAEISLKECLLRVMRLAIEAGHLPLAMADAEKVAPYVHARLQATTILADVRKSAREFSDAELIALAENSDDVADEDDQPPKRLLPLN